MNKNLLVLFLYILIFTVNADEFTFSGNSMKAALTEGRESTILSGDAWIQSKDTLIRAQEITLYGKDFRYAKCTGGVYAKNDEEQIELTAETLFYDRENNYLRASGWARLNDFKNEAILHGGIIEDRQDITILQINAKIVTEDIIARAEHIRFDRDSSIMTLSGLPRVTKNGDSYEARLITINIDNSEITMEGQVKGSFFDENEAEETPETEETSETDDAPASEEVIPELPPNPNETEE